ncbi:hypothetical protein [Spirilliplanes yamanashiensis]|uniref:Uncharacterized protein n=1 Tax=Spirilliplanes yamanashiensis TaxID=42233 RepID=A0A8J4DMM0_9ACTN|nr:hypothetical protein [Spirilliplanes yamanashiensis]MDP9818527.1 hypothetical protein [Spirilliplanes yamanashiensis]GIJ06344.1 hypothetical protein Sya03_56960 [Spirilliplanes yamanashiensis]
MNRRSGPEGAFLVEEAVVTDADLGPSMNEASLKQSRDAFIERLEKAVNAADVAIEQRRQQMHGEVLAALTVRFRSVKALHEAAATLGIPIGPRTAPERIPIQLRRITMTRPAAIFGEQQWRLDDAVAETSSRPSCRSPRRGEAQLRKGRPDCGPVWMRQRMRSRRKIGTSTLNMSVCRARGHSAGWFIDAIARRGATRGAVAALVASGSLRERPSGWQGRSASLDNSPPDIGVEHGLRAVLPVVHPAIPSINRPCGTIGSLNSQLGVSRSQPLRSSSSAPSSTYRAMSSKGVRMASVSRISPCASTETRCQSPPWYQQRSRRPRRGIIGRITPRHHGVPTGMQASRRNGCGRANSATHAPA